MEILNREDILKKLDGEYVEGMVYLRSYAKQPTKNAKYYYSGSIECGGSVPFKVWSGSSCYDELEKDTSRELEGSVCYIRGSINIWSGNHSVVIQSISPVSEVVDVSLFFNSKYNADKLLKEYENVIRGNVDENTYKVYELLVTAEVRERFKREFAALNYHDNCVSGLLAHSLKVTKMCVLMSMYPEITKKVGKDLLFLSSAIHDIGKTLEYSNGSISPIGVSLSHCVSGALYVAEHKDKIVALKGEKFFRDLISVLSQHHGEFGEPCRTVAAYVVHLLDGLDASLTLVNQMIEESGTDGQIVVNSLKLS